MDHHPPLSCEFGRFMLSLRMLSCNEKKKRETEGPIPTNDDETMMKCTTCLKELLVSYLGLKICVTDEENL